MMQPNYTRVIHVPPRGEPVDFYRFTDGELEAIESDARDLFLRQPLDGSHVMSAIDEPHWLGLVIDLARALRHERSVRLHG